MCEILTMVGLGCNGYAAPNVMTIRLNGESTKEP
jgi:hypothetical protein